MTLPGWLDPEIAAALEDLPPTLDAARGIGAFAPPVEARGMPPVEVTDLVVEDRQVPGLDGNPSVPVRTYRRRSRSPQPGPGVLVLHGGGFISGGPALADPTLQQLTRDLDAVVAAPTYRLAPTHPWPAAFEDCRAVLAWMAAAADDLAFPTGELVVFGVSAGAALAVGTALHARDHDGPAIARLVLGFPALDDRLTTPSSHEVTDPRVWNRGMCELSWSAYLRDVPAEEVPPLAAPARVDDLAGLPPTTITVNHHDPLRDEGIEFAARLLRDGVPTALHTMPGTFHGSMGFVPDARVSRLELALLVDAVRGG